MPLPLKSLREKRVKLEIDQEQFPGLNVWHKPSAYTPAYETLVKECLQEEVSSLFLARTLPPLICEWDVTADDAETAAEFGVAVGEPVPITEEALMLLPIELLVEVSKAVHKAHLPFVPTETETGTGSS